MHMYVHVDSVSRVCVYASPTCVRVRGCAYACACVVVCSWLFASIYVWLGEECSTPLERRRKRLETLLYTCLHIANAVLRLGTSPRP